MNDFDPAHYVSQVFSNKPTVALFRSGFATKKAGHVEFLRLKYVLDLPCRNEVTEGSLIVVPTSASFICIQYCLGWCKLVDVAITAIADFP